MKYKMIAADTKQIILVEVDRLYQDKKDSLVPYFKYDCLEGGLNVEQIQLMCGLRDYSGRNIYNFVEVNEYIIIGDWVYIYGGANQLFHWGTLKELSESLQKQERAG